MSFSDLNPEFLAALPPLERRALEAVTAYLGGHGDVAVAARALQELAAKSAVGEPLGAAHLHPTGSANGTSPHSPHRRYSPPGLLLIAPGLWYFSEGLLGPRFAVFSEQIGGDLAHRARHRSRPPHSGQRGAQSTFNP